MEPFRSLALLVDTLALIFALVALSTDYWFVAIGPGFLIHAGIWPEVDHEFVQGNGGREGVVCLVWGAGEKSQRGRVPRGLLSEQALSA